MSQPGVLRPLHLREHDERSDPEAVGDGTGDAERRVAPRRVCRARKPLLVSGRPRIVAAPVPAVHEREVCGGTVLALVDRRSLRVDHEAWRVAPAARVAVLQLVRTLVLRAHALHVEVRHVSIHSTGRDTHRSGHGSRRTGTTHAIVL